LPYHSYGMTQFPRWAGSCAIRHLDRCRLSLCIIASGFGALGYAASTRGKQAGLWPTAIFVVGALYLVNLGFATASRSALVIAPPLLLLLGWRLSRSQGVLVAVLLGVVAATAIRFASPMLRYRVIGSLGERQEVHIDRAASIAEHAAFLRESLTIVAAAPIAGHGTGSVSPCHRWQHWLRGNDDGELAQPDFCGRYSARADRCRRPMGDVARAFVFILRTRGRCLARLSGVVENVLSSIAHSHLFDFNNGWLYVFAVGVLGGTILKERELTSKKTEPSDMTHAA